MDREIVSVIIPIYNTKEYLERCVESVIKQSYKKLEVILVDDGSTDGSAELCDQLHSMDKRISVIHKENGGVVSARLVGLEKAVGEYAILIDSDDWIESRMVQDLHEIAVENDADIVTSGFYREKGKVYGVFADSLKEGIYNSETEKAYLFENMIYHGSLERVGIYGALWSKLIRKTLLKEVHNELDKDIFYGEDMAVTYSCMVRANTIVITHNAFYHYTMRVGSAVYNSSPYYFKNINELFLFLKKEFEKSSFSVELMKQLNLYMIKLVLIGLNQNFTLDYGFSIPYYDFERNVIKQGEKIVLYGAGQVGKSFFKQISADKLYQLVGWVDERYQYYQEQGLHVLSLDKLDELEYNYILLAVKHEELAKEIKEELIKKYNVKEEKIIWLKAVNIIDKYNSLK